MFTADISCESCSQFDSLPLTSVAQKKAWVHWGDMRHDSFADVVAAAVMYYGLQWDRRVFTSPSELEAAVSSLADFAGAREGNEDDDASSSSSDGGPGQGEWRSDDSLHSSSSSSTSSSSDGESDDGAKRFAAMRADNRERFIMELDHSTREGESSVYVILCTAPFYFLCEFCSQFGLAPPRASLTLVSIYDAGRRIRDLGGRPARPPAQLCAGEHGANVVALWNDGDGATSRALPVAHVDHRNEARQVCRGLRPDWVDLPRALRCDCFQAASARAVRHPRARHTSARAVGLPELYRSHCRRHCCTGEFFIYLFIYAFLLRKNESSPHVCSLPQI